MNFLTSIFLFSTICVVNVYTGEIITSPPATNWGAWSAFQHCPEGTFAKGFQLKVQPSQGIIIDDTALNGVKLFCGYPTDPETVNITSGEGIHGVWGRVFSCGGGYIYGFQLRVEQNGIDDETATDNIRAFCTNAEPDVFIEGDGTTFGSWRTEVKCARTQGLCGLQTQIQADGGLLQDDTAMNNMAAECCDLPPPATTTTKAPTTQAPSTTSTQSPSTTSTQSRVTSSQAA